MFSVFCVLFGASAAQAEGGVVIAHQGRLVDAGDTPVEGVKTFTVKLYSKSDGTSSDVVWSETYEVQVVKGFFVIGLGDTRNSKAELPASVLVGDRWLGVTLETVEFSPRLRLGVVPSALNAANLGGVPAASYALKTDTAPDAQKLGGVEAAAYALKTDVPATAKDSEKLGGVVAAEYALRTDTAPNALKLGDLAAADYARRTDTAPNALKLGDVAAADYARRTDTAPNALKLGDVAAAEYALKTDTAPNALKLGGLDASQFVTLAGGQTLSLSGAGSFGQVVLKPQTTAPTCDASATGALYFDQATKAFQGCDGARWVPFRGRTAGDGPETAGVNCADLKTKLGATAKDGSYWIDPDGATGESPFVAYCDMTTDGGGWTLCFAYDNGTYDAANWPTIQEARNKMLARKWGQTNLFGNGSTQGNFCSLLAVTANTTRVRGEVVRAYDSNVAMSGVFTLKKANFFTQVHDHTNRRFDCLVDSTGAKRLIYGNYSSPALGTYNQAYLESCTGTANDHFDAQAGKPGSVNSIDGLLVMSNAISGADATKELSLHVNWYGDATSLSLYTTNVEATQTKFGVDAIWRVNAFGRGGASPGLQFCTTYCGYTNQVTAMWKQRLWVK